MVELFKDTRVYDRLRVASWILEFLGVLISIIILGITASAAEGMMNDLLFPSIPGKLAYNIAIAAITMLVLLVLFCLDVSRNTTWKRWNDYQRPWPRVSLNIVFMALWIGAIASSFYTCSDLCSASGEQYVWIRYASLCCDCTRSAFTASCGSASSSYSSVEQRTGRYEATEALDILLFVVFLASTFVLGAFHWVVESDEQSSAGLETLERRNGEQAAFY